MSEERLDQGEGKLDPHDVQLGRIKTELATLVVGQSSLLNAVDELQAGQLLMREELTRHMHVLHEDVVDGMKAMDQTDRLERLIKATDNATRRRLDSVQLHKPRTQRRSPPNKAS